MSGAGPMDQHKTGLKIKLKLPFKHLVRDTGSPHPTTPEASQLRSLQALLPPLPESALDSELQPAQPASFLSRSMDPRPVEPHPPLPEPVISSEPYCLKPRPTSPGSTGHRPQTQPASIAKPPLAAAAAAAAYRPAQLGMPADDAVLTDSSNQVPMQKAANGTAIIDMPHAAKACGQPAAACLEPSLATSALAAGKDCSKQTGAAVHRKAALKTDPPQAERPPDCGGKLPQAATFLTPRKPVAVRNDQQAVSSGQQAPRGPPPLGISKPMTAVGPMAAVGAIAARKSAPDANKHASRPQSKVALLTGPTGESFRNHGGCNAKLVADCAAMGDDTEDGEISSDDLEEQQQCEVTGTLVHARAGAGGLSQTNTANQQAAMPQRLQSQHERSPHAECGKAGALSPRITATQQITQPQGQRSQPDGSPFAGGTQAGGLSSAATATRHNVLQSRPTSAEVLQPPPTLHPLSAISSPMNHATRTPTKADALARKPQPAAVQNSHKASIEKGQLQSCTSTAVPSGIISSAERPQAAQGSFQAASQQLSPGRPAVKRNAHRNDSPALPGVTQAAAAAAAHRGHESATGHSLVGQAEDPMLEEGDGGSVLPAGGWPDNDGCPFSWLACVAPPGPLDATALPPVAPPEHHPITPGGDRVMQEGLHPEGACVALPGQPNVGALSLTAAHQAPTQRPFLGITPVTQPHTLPAEAPYVYKGGVQPGLNTQLHSAHPSHVGVGNDKSVRVGLQPSLAAARRDMPCVTSFPPRPTQPGTEEAMVHGSATTEMRVMQSPPMQNINNPGLERLNAYQCPQLQQDEDDLADILPSSQDIEDAGYEGFGCIGLNQEPISQERQLVLAQVQSALEEHEPIDLESAAQALGMPFPPPKKRVISDLFPNSWPLALDHMSRRCNTSWTCILGRSVSGQHEAQRRKPSILRIKISLSGRCTVHLFCLYARNLHLFALLVNAQMCWLMHCTWSAHGGRRDLSILVE